MDTCLRWWRVTNGLPRLHMAGASAEPLAEGICGGGDGRSMNFRQTHHCASVLRFFLGVSRARAHGEKRALLASVELPTQDGRVRAQPTLAMGDVQRNLLQLLLDRGAHYGLPIFRIVAPEPSGTLLTDLLRVRRRRCVL